MLTIVFDLDGTLIDTAPAIWSDTLNLHSSGARRALSGRSIRPLAN